MITVRLAMYGVNSNERMKLRPIEAVTEGYRDTSIEFTLDLERENIIGTEMIGLLFDATRTELELFIAELQAIVDGNPDIDNPTLADIEAGLAGDFEDA